MKKRKFFNLLKLFIVFCIVVPCSIFFTACKDTQTPYIGENGNWFIGDTDTGVKANGTDGKDGKDGQDGTNGTDGKDAEPVDTYQIYLDAVEHENYQGTYLDFVKEYFDVTTDITSAVANKSVMSVVGIRAYNVTSAQTKGSGVIYDIDVNGNAIILTNYHVACGQGKIPFQKIECHLYQQDSYFQTTFIGGSSTYDIAVLKVENCGILKNSNATAVTLNTNKLSLGETCIAVGNPSGYGIAVTKGAIGVDSEYVSMTVAEETRIRRVLRHDAYTTGGSSGGGLFDINGYLIGLTNGGISGTDINYAIPADLVEKVVTDILKNTNSGKVNTLNLGIETDSTTSSTLNPDKTIFVVDKIFISDIGDGIVANNGALAVGDQIISITLAPGTADEETITFEREHEFKEFLITLQHGTTIKLNALRNGSSTVSFTHTILTGDLTIVK